MLRFILPLRLIVPALWMGLIIGLSFIETPLKFLAPGWFSIVMGLSGLALALASLLRWQRHAQAWAEDLCHPVRHVFVAAMPVSLILLATMAVALGGPTPWARGLWMTGSVWQHGVTLCVTRGRHPLAKSTAMRGG